VSGLIRLRRGTAVLAASGIALVPVLAACGAGQLAETAKIKPTIRGADASVGHLGVRNAMVAYSETGIWSQGGDAPLNVWLANYGDGDDRLVGVTTDAARSVLLVGSEPGAQPLNSATPSSSASSQATAQATASASGSPSSSAGPTGSATPSGSPSASASSSASAAPTGSARPTASPSASQAPAGRPVDVKLPAQSLVRLPEDGPHLELRNLTKNLTPNSVISVTFRFEKAGSVTMRLPMDTPNTPAPRSPIPGWVPPVESTDNSGGEG
jgi:copper(I)-binding protein